MDSIMLQNGQVIEVSIKSIEVFSIISSALSLILAIVAIKLSFIFFKMSEKSAKEADVSSRNIEAAVKKLETLFDKLYSGTFDIVRETVSDMRKHLYSNGRDIASEKIGQEIEEKTNTAVLKAVEEIKSSQKTDKELEELIRAVISKTKEVEKAAKSSLLRKAVLNYLKDNGEVTYGNLEKAMIECKFMNKNNDPSLFQELEVLSEEGIIVDPFNIGFDGDRVIYFEAKVRLK